MIIVQISNNSVHIKGEAEQFYLDSYDNYKLDGGSLDNVYSVYDDFQPYYMLNDQPMTEYDKQTYSLEAARVGTLIKSKELREANSVTEDEKLERKISELKGKLEQTDYVASKIAEGEATKEEYAEVLAQRRAWREEIRTLQSELESITSS